MKQLFAGREPPNTWQGVGQPPGIVRGPPGHRKNTLPLREWINLYDANLRWADWAVGEVEGLLRRAGVFDDTLSVVTSDHGEAFGEHGYVYHSWACTTNLFACRF